MAEVGADALSVGIMDNLSDRTSTTSDEMSQGTPFESEEELFEVERIVGMSKAGGKVTYKVRWKNYGPADDTWEPIENLQSCLDVVEEYEKKRDEAIEKRREERQKRKAIMEGRVTSIEDESSRESMNSDSPSHNPTFKNGFWKDLEAGKVNLFTTDMYSRVKGGGRASRPTCLKDEHKTKEEDTEEKPKRRKREKKKLRERDKRMKENKRKKSLEMKHSKLSKEIISSSDMDSGNSDTDIVNEKDLVTLPVIDMKSMQSEFRKSERTNADFTKDLSITKLHGSEGKVKSEDTDETPKEKETARIKSSTDVDLKSSKFDAFTKVKIKPFTKDLPRNTSKSKSPKVESVKKLDSVENPASPIKSYLSGGSTPPRKLSIDTPSKPPQATSTPNSKSLPEKQRQLSIKSPDSSSSSLSSTNIGVKRKQSTDNNSHSHSSAKIFKQRRDSEQSLSRDSGLGGSTSSVSSLDLDKNRATKRKDSSNSGEYTQPLDELWNGSLLPLLPESTKTQERGADLSFDIELDDIDLDQLDKELPEEGVDAIVITDAKFQQSVTDGDYHMVRKALNSTKKYDVEAVDDLGITLLMYSAQNAYDDIAELLVNKGADVNAQQKNGTTSLMLACEHAHICTVALLIELGACINLQQDSGETALMKAVKRGHKQIVKFLMENGANFSAQNNSGFTAVTYAKMLRFTEIEDIIVDHITRLTKEFDKQVAITLNNTAKITSALFPLQVFPLCEGDKYVVNFKHELQPNTPGVGYLLFIAHARITATDCKCRFYGPCAVTTATLNGVPQPPLTEEANFVMSCCPLQNGRNEIVVNTVKAPNSKAKLVVCAYKAQVIDG